MGHPTDKEFVGLVRAKMIPNCDVTESAVKNALTSFGPDLAGVKGRTVRRPPEQVLMECIKIPWLVLDRFQRVMLAVDVMFVNTVPFLVSVL